MNFRSALLTASMIILLAGCQPSKVADEVGSSCAPKNLAVKASNEAMTVSWRPDCNQLISGYYIFISEQPLFEKFGNTFLPKSVKPFNDAAFAGDTEPADGIENFEAGGLENGKKYYVSVRTIFPDLTLSKSSNEQVVVCGPRGEIELSIRYKSERDGYSFSRDIFVRADDLDNDIYYHTLSGKDYLGSPEKLDGFLRKNRLTVLPYKGDFETVREKAAGSGVEPDQLRVEVKKDDWVLIKSEEGNLGLLKILGFGGDGEERRIELYFAYSTISGELLF